MQAVKQTPTPPATEHKKSEDVVPSSTLWAIELSFNHDNEIKLHRFRNFTNTDLMKFRNNIFQSGFMYPIDPGHFILISPFNIRQIDVFKQAKRLPDY